MGLNAGPQQTTVFASATQPNCLFLLCLGMIQLDGLDMDAAF